LHVYRKIQVIKKYDPDRVSQVSINIAGIFRCVIYPSQSLASRYHPQVSIGPRIPASIAGLSAAELSKSFQSIKRDVVYFSFPSNPGVMSGLYGAGLILSVKGSFSSISDRLCYKPRTDV